MNVGGDYAETDLDQPTDYSLRYAEDDTDEEEKQSAEYFDGNGREEDKQSTEYFHGDGQENKRNTGYFHGSEQEDTVKTYCTEGTPYETPFNFSTATSMSDLRLEDAKENADLVKKLPKKELDATDKVPASNFDKRTDSLDCIEADNDDGFVTKEANPKDNAILNPGQVTPEKIVSYYEEEAHEFSHANSLSSLNSAVTPQKNGAGVTSKVDSPASESKEELENNDQDAVDHDQIISPSESVSNGNKQVVTNNLLDKGKMVKFGNDDYYAEETPMMFSRCSSLGSLNGFEQHSIHDDHSSVISDFSRSTSGAISPSELPDSPTQTALLSPRNHKTQNAEFISKMQEEAVRPSVRHLSFPKPETQTRSSVFEDAVATFKVELSPIEFSTATSLSSLTIDYETKTSNDAEAYGRSEKTVDASEKDIGQLETDMLNMTLNKSESKTKEEQVSDGDEDDEDMLAACINMGMQTSRYRQSLQTLGSQKSAQSEVSNILVSYQRNSVSSRLESHATSVETSIGAPSVPSVKTSRSAMEIVASDTVHIYCTEDTPADISPVGSHTNLSALSMPSVQEEKIEPTKPAELESCHRNDSFDEDSNLSGDDEKILNECIQSGIPKARQITVPPIDGIVAKKLEPPYKFNIYGTPSSSPVELSHDKNPMLSKSSANASSRHLDEFLENSPNQSDDEAILTECIQSAMPKAKFTASPSIRSPISQTVNNSKAMNARMYSTASSAFQPRHMERRKSVGKKFSSFEDNVGLSEEEEDVMLAQCIKSGMPKASSFMSTTTASAVKKSVLCLGSKATGIVPVSLSSFTNKPHPGMIKNVASYPSQRSMNLNPVDVRFARNALGYNCFPGKSASSTVTQITSETLRNCDSGARERMNNSPYYARRSSSLPSSYYNQHHQHQQHHHQHQHQHQQQQQQQQQHHHHHHHHTENENGNLVDVCMPMRSRVKCDALSLFNRVENYDDHSCRNSIKSNAMPLRYSSANSPKETGSPMIPRDEWPLLELCIASGVPRNKYRVRGTKGGNEGAISGSHDDCEPNPEDTYPTCGYNSCACKT